MTPSSVVSFFSLPFTRILNGVGEINNSYRIISWYSVLYNKVFTFL